MRYVRCAASFIALGLALSVCEASASEVQQAAPKSVHEAMFVTLNGVQQWITVRGDDVRNPVVLMLHGGPGFPTSQWAPIYASFESDYALVQWDQPGGGATYAKNIGKDIGPLTIERYRSDGIALAKFLEAHLHADKIILYGTSWGTILGLEMARTRPDLFLAYVGISQVAGLRSDLLGYQLALKAAQSRGDTKAVADPKRVGPPPYRSFEDYIVQKTFTNPPGLPPTPQEQAGYAALAKLAASTGPDAEYVAHGLPSYDGTKVFLDTSKALFGQEENWGPFKLSMSFHMPLMVLNGDHDFNTPQQTAMDLCHTISDPHKHCEVIPGYGHGTIPSDVILDRMAKYIRPFVTK